MNTTLIPMNLEQYLEQEERASIKHEFVHGQLYAMAGATENHNLIVGNIVFELTLVARAKKEKRCRVMQSDMKLTIVQPPIVSYYPDVIVICDDSDNDPIFKTKPCFIVEVLSESTKRIDLTEKKTNYQRIKSLKAYMIVHQDQQFVELHRRFENNTWQLEQYTEGDIEIPCPSTTLSLEQIYAGIGVP
jgi:Uma2 family endonuclease